MPLVADDVNAFAASNRSIVVEVGGYRVAGDSVLDAERSEGKEARSIPFRPIMMSGVAHRALARGGGGGTRRVAGGD